MRAKAETARQAHLLRERIRAEINDLKVVAVGGYDDELTLLKQRQTMVKQLDQFIEKMEREAEALRRSTSVVSANSLSSQAMKHIFEGEINRSGKAVGFHFEKTAKDAKVVKGTVIEGENGVYTAEVEVQGIRKVSNAGRSTFFPKAWTEEQVIQAIDEAWKNKTLKPGTTNIYEGRGGGIKIEIITGKDGIITSYPSWPQ